MNERLGYYEFFAGGGMARLGLGKRWRCLFANDICLKKAQAYQKNFPLEGKLAIKDINEVSINDLPGGAHLSWASFPCQDLSLAGSRKGLKGKRSNTFWPFWELMRRLVSDGRAVPLIVLENVVGAIFSDDGKDFQAIVGALAEIGYRTGALVMDSVHFTPQSRPRLFIIATNLHSEVTRGLQSKMPSTHWHSKALIRSFHRLPEHLQNKWIWWGLSAPPKRVTMMSDIIDEEPSGVSWHSVEQTGKLLSLMSDVNIQKVHRALSLNKRIIGTIYKRTRRDGTGAKIQRAEVRFDQISGCLRTPAGGSSREIIIVVAKGQVRSRLLSPREAARLMGVPEHYQLPSNYNEAYHLMGDGLVVPVVSWLEKHLLYPLAITTEKTMENECERYSNYSLHPSA